MPHIYLYMSSNRIVNQHKAQHELFQIVFPVQHSYLDTSTSKADYIITFLGLWDLCFTWKTIHTSWPSFSLVSNVSDNTQSSPQSRDILRLKHLIIEKNREISELLEQCESRILTKQRKDKINYTLKSFFGS